MKNKYNIIEVVEASAVAANNVYSAYTIITFYNDTSKFKIADGKTKFNDLEYIGSSGSGEAVAWGDITNKPTTFDPKIGVTATTALAGNTPIPAPATVAPVVAGTAAVGTSALYARQDHVHPTQTSVATLSTGRTFSLTGGATGTSGSFNGSANASIAVTLATPSATVRGGVLQGGAVADATDEATAITQLNDLLAKLRTAGIIAT